LIFFLIPAFFFVYVTAVINVGLMWLAIGVFLKIVPLYWKLIHQIFGFQKLWLDYQDNC